MFYEGGDTLDVIYRSGRTFSGEDDYLYSSNLNEATTEFTNIFAGLLESSQDYLDSDHQLQVGDRYFSHNDFMGTFTMKVHENGSIHEYREIVDQFYWVLSEKIEDPSERKEFLQCLRTALYDGDPVRVKDFFGKYLPGITYEEVMMVDFSRFREGVTSDSVPQTVSESLSSEEWHGFEGMRMGILKESDKQRIDEIRKGLRSD